MRGSQGALPAVRPRRGRDSNAGARRGNQGTMMEFKISRRSFFARAGAGFAGLALIDLLSRDGFFAQSSGPLREPARRGAKHCVFLFMNGAPSQVDTFDHKPALTRYHNLPYRGNTPVGSNGRPIGNLMQTPFTFRRFGQSGLEISALFPHTSRYADNLCVLRQ